MSTTATPDYIAITERQQATWATGDFHVIGARITITADRLCDDADLRAGWRVLDIATGSGNAALSAARHGCRAVGVDFVPALLERARARAATEGLPVEFVQGDAQRLPFESDSFDAVTSVFGNMFAPDHQAVASEIIRVTRPGGVVGLVTWPPTGFIGELFRVVGGYVPPPPGLTPGTAWSQDEYLRELFGANLAELHSTRHTLTFRASSPQEFVDVFRTWYGPVVRAFAALDDGRRRSLERDLVDLAVRYDRLGDGATAIPATYVQSVMRLAG